MNEDETFLEALRTFEFVHERAGVVVDCVTAFIHRAFYLLEVGSVEIDSSEWRPVTLS